MHRLRGEQIKLTDKVKEMKEKKVNYLTIAI